MDKNVIVGKLVYLKIGATKPRQMENSEKARELINKHLYLHGGDKLGITDGDVYRAVLDAVCEALTIPAVSERVWTADEIISILETHEDADEHAKWFDKHGR